MTDADAFLAVREVSKTFGGLQALDRVTFAVCAGQLFSIIGPNGAGKTTLFNTISGMLTCTAGEIHLRDLPLHTLDPKAIARAGVARTFQNVRLFPTLTVLENVLAGCEAKAAKSLVATGLMRPAVRRMEREMRERALHWLDWLQLAQHRDRPAASLPYGLQKRLEIARALGTDPIVLLLDEPAAGLNAVEVRELEQTIERIRAALGLTVLLIDHHADLVMSLSDRILVLNFGRVLTTGTPSEVRGDPRVVAAYLGT